MARYFKITEIDEDTFARETGDFLDCDSVVDPVDGHVYVAVDDNTEDEFSVYLDAFDTEELAGG